MQNASPQYINPGIYTVSLIAINEDGSVNVIKTNYINIIDQNTIANFTSNISQIPVNGFKQFYDNSTNNPTQWTPNGWFGRNLYGQLQSL